MLAAEYAFAFGHLLAEVKAELGHGLFKRWIAAHCEFSHRTAARYMKFARDVGNETALSPLPPDAYARSLQPSARRVAARTVPRLPRPADDSRGDSVFHIDHGADADNQYLIRTIVSERAREALNYSDPPYPMDGIENGLWITVHFLNSRDRDEFFAKIGHPPTSMRKIAYPPLRFVNTPEEPT